MILTHIHVDGFGRLANLDLDFADGVNLIYGDNEAGKSTLCNFIFHMLYGMERGRGKASRFDVYTRYLPRTGIGYGGSLTFEADGCTWLLERSFLTENRFLRVIRLDDGVICSDPEAMLDELRGHITAPDYQSLFMFSQQNGVDLSALSTSLRQYTQNLPGSRSVSFSASRALKSLNRQKRECDARLSGLGKGDLYRVEDELNRVRHDLNALTDALDRETPADPPDDEVEQTAEASHRSYVSFLLAALMFFLSAAVLLSPSIISHLPDGPGHYLPCVLCFAVGLSVLLHFFMKKRRPHSSDDSEEFLTDEFPDEADDDDSPCATSTVELVNLLLEREEMLSEEHATLTRQLAADEQLRQQISALRLATDTIASLSAEIHQTYSPDLQRTFARHASMLTGRPFSQIMIDEEFHFSLMEEGHCVPLDALSRGTMEQLILSCRLASCQLLYPEVSLPLLMDDIFALTDDSRLSVLLSRLSLDHSGQKLIFSCQKREAAILSQHSLSYHLIQL